MKRLSQGVMIILLLFVRDSYCQPNQAAEGRCDNISFVQSRQDLGDTRTFGLAIADVDDDGDNDILIANYVGASHLWLNDGHGVFTPSSQAFGPAGASTHDVGIADLNGDGSLDIFMANHDAPSRVYFNQGHRHFVLGEQVIGSSDEHPVNVQLEDVDGDGDVDAYLYNIDSPNRFWYNDGRGHFTMGSEDYGGSSSHGQRLAQFNRDTYPDMYISYRNGAPAEIWLNDGTGRMVDTGQKLGRGGRAVDFGDVDGDGDVDIIMGGQDIAIWINQNNTGSFIQDHRLEELALRSHLFDADQDGDLDLVTINPNDGNALWLNDGSGRFTFQGRVFGKARMFCIGSAKLDDDDSADLVFGGMNGAVGNLLFFNRSHPAEE